MTDDDGGLLGTGGAKPRHRFTRKAIDAGFHQRVALRNDEIARYALEAMSLVWPRKAFVFEQVLVRHRLVQDLARELDVDERTVRRDLEGYGKGRDREFGGEDWFLILFELFREADSCVSDGAELLHASLLGAGDGDTPLGPFHTSFVLMVLRALVGGDLPDLFGNLPWQENPGRTVAWPCFDQLAPLPSSWLPGLMAGLRSSAGENRFWHCWLHAQLSARDDAPRLWPTLALLLADLARGDPGRPDDGAGLSRAAALLQSQPLHLHSATVGVLASSDLPWAELCRRIEHKDLREAPPAARARIAAQHYLRALRSAGPTHAD